MSNNNEEQGLPGAPGLSHFGRFGVKSILSYSYEVKAIIRGVWPPSPPDYGMVLSLTFVECLAEVLSLLLQPWGTTDIRTSAGAMHAWPRGQACHVPEGSLRPAGKLRLDLPKQLL